MTVKERTRRPRSYTYATLLDRFALRPIKSDQQYERAVAIIAELLTRKLDRGADDYLQTLILLVTKYEDEHHTPCDPGLTPQAALRAIMESNHLTQAEIGAIVGSESAVSMFLNGQRALSKSRIKALADRFRVDAGLFLEEK